MFYRLRTQSIAVPLVFAAILVSPVAALSEESKPRDNSGRRLAMAVPPPPAAAKPVTAVPAVPVIPPALQQKAAEMTPQLKEMAQKGGQIAQGVSHIAVKRAGDVMVWVNTMWQELNDTPAITPVREYRAPMPPLHSMRPMDAGQGNRLYFTNERRLKTVVAR